MTKLQGNLDINGLELYVNLGWRDKELLEPQAIMLDLQIIFYGAPAAVVSDDLKDTLCYAELIEKIRTHVANKQYRLIEHLSAEIYEIVAAKAPATATSFVRLTKKPKIKGLNSVTFTCFKSSNP